MFGEGLARQSFVCGLAGGGVSVRPTAFWVFAFCTSVLPKLLQYPAQGAYASMDVPIAIAAACMIGMFVLSMDHAAGHD